MARCGRCSKKAAVGMRYGPHRFCEAHFARFFERRVKRTIRKFGLVRRGEHIAVAVSGGKDSAVTLYLLHNLFHSSNKITAIMVDEGVAGYRDKALALARKNCNEWGIEYKEASFKERFGVSLEEIMKKIGLGMEHGTSCSYCGVFRRKLINALAREVHADKVATGHNLDDEVQSIVMNIFEGDVARLARLGAITESGISKAFVPRIKPLYECPEDEVVRYAEIMGIEAYVKKCCPYRWQAKRNAFRKMVDEFEVKVPGTKYSVLKGFLGIKKALGKVPHGEISRCKKCGEPANSEICQSCKHIERLGKL